MRPAAEPPGSVGRLTYVPAGRAKLGAAVVVAAIATGCGDDAEEVRTGPGDPAPRLTGVRTARIVWSSSFDQPRDPAGWDVMETLTGPAPADDLFRSATLDGWYHVVYGGGDGRIAIVPRGVAPRRDAEVRSLWGPSSSGGIAGHGQAGHVLRLVDAGRPTERGVVVARDLFAPRFHNVLVAGAGWWGSGGREGVLVARLDFGDHLGTGGELAPYWVATRLVDDVVEVKV
jgi:hypothetical protein